MKFMWYVKFTDGSYSEVPTEDLELFLSDDTKEDIVFIRNMSLKDSFPEWIRKNREEIRKAAEQNTVRNEDGLTVIEQGDPWRDEHEWDSDK